MTEQWKPVVGYEGLYEVSSNGYVKSLARVVRFGSRTRIIPERILLPHRHIKGYFRVDLCKAGGYNHQFVHRIVAQAFISNHDNKAVVNHKDSDRHNNTVENLEWVTYEENAAHRDQAERARVLASNASF